MEEISRGNSRGHARAAFTDDVGAQVPQVQVQSIVFVVPTRPLNEGVTCDHIGEVIPDLHGMPRKCFREVVSRLELSLNVALGRVRVRADLQAIEVLKNQIGELIQTRELEIPDRIIIVLPAVRDAELVDRGRRKCVEFGQRKHHAGCPESVYRRPATAQTCRSCVFLL